MLLKIIFCVPVPLVLAFYFWGKKKLNAVQEKGIPCLEPSFPLGNMKGVGISVSMNERSQEIYEACKKRDKIAGFYSLLWPTIMLTDLDLIKTVLIKDFNNFTDRGLYHNAEADPVSAHVLALSGDEWRFIRNKLTPTFTTGKMKNMFGTIVEISEEMTKFIDSGKELEVGDLCTRFICDIIGSVAFGLDCEALKGENSGLLEVGSKLKNLSAGDTFRLFFVNSFMNFSKFFNIRLFNKYCSNFFIETLRQTIKFREENDVKRQDFLNSLIQLKNTGTIDGAKMDNDKKLTFNQISAQGKFFK